MYYVDVIRRSETRNGEFRETIFVSPLQFSPPHFKSDGEESVKGIEKGKDSPQSISFSRIRIEKRNGLDQEGRREDFVTE
jgi:hypothetical protein